MLSSVANVELNSTLIYLDSTIGASHASMTFSADLAIISNSGTLRRRPQNRHYGEPWFFPKSSVGSVARRTLAVPAQTLQLEYKPGLTRVELRTVTRQVPRPSLRRRGFLQSQLFRDTLHRGDDVRDVVVERKPQQCRALFDVLAFDGGGK